MEDLTCAICYETFDNCQNGSQKAIMPCCEVDQASTVFCVRCIELICQRFSGHDDNIGKCPRCNQFIQVRDGAVVKSTAPLVQCIICKQKRLPFDRSSDLRDKVCVACYTGIHNRLRYECESCHRIQMIPHPMYRYQEYPTSFSTNTWACHLGCHDYTRWRILASDVRKVPLDDTPDSWGLQEQEFETIRGIRRAELQSAGRGGAMIMDGGEIAPSSLLSRFSAIFRGLFSMTTDSGDGNTSSSS